MRGARVRGDLIRQLRLSKGLTQEQLASLAEMDETTLRRMEKGERSFDVRSIADLAKALKCDLVMLLAGERNHRIFCQQQCVNLQCVAQHRQSFLEKDIERVLACYTDDAVIIFPASIPSKSSGKFAGKNQIREHLRLTFQTFTPQIPTLDESDVYAFENLVIVRHTATATVLQNGSQFRSECLLEFWFRASKICKHIGLFDTAVIAQASVIYIRPVGGVQRRAYARG